MSTFVAPKTMDRIRAMRLEYLKMFPESPLVNYTSDTDILLFILFYGESKMIERIEKKRIFGGAATPDPD